MVADFGDDAVCACVTVQRESTGATYSQKVPHEERLFIELDCSGGSICQCLACFDGNGTGVRCAVPGGDDCCAA